MVLSTRVLVAVVALVWAFAGLGQSAHALGKHRSNTPSLQHKAKKKNSPYAYLAPQKQKKASAHYVSPVTGQLLYGTKKK